VRDAVWLSGSVPYEQAATILERIGGVHISKVTTWRKVQGWGAKLEELSELERERATALPEKWEPPSRREVADQRMGVAMDGTMVNIVDEGWKELKVGTVFDVAVEPMRDQGTGDLEELGHAENCSYVAHLGGPEILGQMVWAEARGRKWEEAQDTMVIGDGAAWIWNQAGQHFGYSEQLVDWYHAKQHLVIAAQMLKGDNEKAYQRWLNGRETMLYQGHAERIADELCAAALAYPEHTVGLLREAGYFRQNKRRMQYLEMREEGWPIGSGMVESGGKGSLLWSRHALESIGRREPSPGTYSYHEQVLRPSLGTYLRLAPRLKRTLPSAHGRGPPHPAAGPRRRGTPGIW